MQTILSEKQIELLNLNHMNYKPFIDNHHSNYPRIKRQIKHYNIHPSAAWDADKSIMLLAWLSLQDEVDEKIKNIKYVLNGESFVSNENFLDIKIKVRKDIRSFYTKLSELNDFRFLSWFFCHTDSILKIYKYDTRKVINLKYHQFEVNTPEFKLKGSQGFALNWLLERIQIIIKYDYRQEDVKKFFLVWAEVHPMFWW